MITIRTISVGAKNLRHDPATPITVPTNVSTALLPDESVNFGEIEYRFIQNVGGNNLYYTVNGDCNGAADCSGMLTPGQQLDCSHYQKVTGYCTGGTTVAITVARTSTL
jgi:hypothetical protein